MSILNKATYEGVLRSSQLPPLSRAKVKLKLYSGDAIPVMGMTSLVARYKSIEHTINMWFLAGPNTFRQRHVTSL